MIDMGTGLRQLLSGIPSLIVQFQFRKAIPAITLSYVMENVVESEKLARVIAGRILQLHEEFILFCFLMEAKWKTEVSQIIVRIPTHHQ